MSTRKFTFFELLIVATILAMLSAFVLPQIMKIPKRIEVEKALTDIRQAISETGMRARTTGTPLELKLDEENSVFSVGPVEKIRAVADSWTPPANINTEAKLASALAIDAKSSYSLPGTIEWLPEETGLTDFDYVSFCFFEDGQASGLPLRFNVAGRRFLLEVDRLTGDPVIYELN